MAKRKSSKPAAAKKKTAKSSGWIVTTNNDRPIREVAQDLSQAGFQVRDVLDEIGSITGSADSSAVAKMRKIKGVADVAE
jgi:hypothetical protein